LVIWLRKSSVRILFCTLFLGTSTGCSRQGAGTGSTDTPVINVPGDDREVAMGKTPKREFKEYVKNPELFRQETEEIEETDNAPPPSPRQLATSSPQWASGGRVVGIFHGEIRSDRKIA
jgi:hypothetical protein